MLLPNTLTRVRRKKLAVPQHVPDGRIAHHRGVTNRYKTAHTLARQASGANRYDDATHRPVVEIQSPESGQIKSALDPRRLATPAPLTSS